MSGTMIVAVAKESLGWLVELVNQFASNQLTYDELWVAVAEAFDTNHIVDVDLQVGI